MNTSPPGGLAVNVVELNPYAPRPYVFTEAALCLRDSIRAAGFGSELWVNEADAQSITIVLGAVPPRCSVVERLDPRKTVVFNFEQLGSSSALVNRDYLGWLRGRLVADYHSRNVDYLTREHGGEQRVFELPLVPSASLAPAGHAATAKTVDVLFFGTLIDRRSEIVRRLEAAGITVETVAGAYAHELTPAILRARIVLHVHYYDTGLFPVARFLQPVVLGVPVVCETSAFSAGSDWSRSGIVFADYENIVTACRDLLRSPAEQAERAQRSLRFAGELDFATPFRHLLGDLLRGLAAGPPAQPAIAQTTGEERGEGEPLPDEEIDAILACEAGELPPESHLTAPPVSLVQRGLGQGGLGRWPAWLLLAFSLALIWQSMR